MWGNPVTRSLFMKRGSAVASGTTSRSFVLCTQWAQKASFLEVSLTSPSPRLDMNHCRPMSMRLTREMGTSKIREHRAVIRSKAASLSESRSRYELSTVSRSCSSWYDWGRDDFSSMFSVTQSSSYGRALRGRPHESVAPRPPEPEPLPPSPPPPADAEALPPFTFQSLPSSSDRRYPSSVSSSESSPKRYPEGLLLGTRSPPASIPVPRRVQSWSAALSSL
mmetsp:Transcript_29881/g.88810  ORF Transcript_29881/g.88810 Transcript_29881/m.88810 type:complete len:222 (-) Transcript_29881:312-977(-)